MVMARLGAASMKLVFSDKEGLKALHGDTGDVLLNVPPSLLQTNDWNRVWDVLRDIETDAFLRWKAANSSKTATDYHEEFGV